MYEKKIVSCFKHVISIINFAVFNTAWFCLGEGYLDYKGEIKISDVTSNLICLFTIYYAYML